MTNILEGRDTRRTGLFLGFPSFHIFLEDVGVVATMVTYYRSATLILTRIVITLNASG